MSNSASSEAGKVGPFVAGSSMSDLISLGSRKALVFTWWTRGNRIATLSDSGTSN